MSDREVKNAQVLDEKQAVSFVEKSVFDAFVKSTEARFAKIEARVNINDKAFEMPEKRNYNTDFLPHGVSGVVTIDDLTKKVG